MATESVPPVSSTTPPVTPPTMPQSDTATEEHPPATEPQRQSPPRVRRESNINVADPHAFKITILLASSGNRTQLSINRSSLEKASLVEGDGFLISQLKNAIWKDWPSGISLSGTLINTQIGRIHYRRVQTFYD
jgi:hypothetical protein